MTQDLEREPAANGTEQPPKAPAWKKFFQPDTYGPFRDRFAERLASARSALKDSSDKIAARLPPLGDKFPSLYRIKNKLPALPYSRVLVLISSMSVSYKIAATLITVLALAIASLGFVTFSNQKRILQQETRKRAEVLVQHLANLGKEALLTKQELPVYAALKDFQSNLGVVYGLVADDANRVFVHSTLERKGSELSGVIDQAAFAADGLFFQETVYRGEPVLDASLPIMMRSRTTKIGVARIGLSQRELLESIRQQKKVFFWISVVFVAIGLLISFGLAKVLTRPIYTLAVGMQEVAQGDLSQQVKVFYKDEIGKLTEVFNQMIMSLREKLQMEKYLSNTLIKTIKQRRHTSGQLKLGGENKFVTALFSDVRGFTAMSEKMTPEEVVGLLNIYLNLQGKVVLQRGGVVDKFVGDEIMAIFEGRGQEVNAVRAAVEIQRYCQALNWARARAGQRQMQVGVGLNSGTVVMGNMGSEEQMNYTVIGDNINLAARLCGVAGAGQVVVSKAVADALGKEAKLRKLDAVTVKGKEKAVEVFEVLDVNGASRKYMRRAIDFPAVYRLAGLPDETPGALKNLGSAGALLEAAAPVGVGSRLSVDVTLGDRALKGVESVVRHVRKQDGKYFVGLHFETLSDADRAFLVDWTHRIESEIVHPGAPAA